MDIPNDKNDIDKILWDFPENQNVLYVTRKTTYSIVDLAVSADHRVKKKQKRVKYLDLAGELRKLWNMRVTVILIEIGTLRSCSKRVR